MINLNEGGLKLVNGGMDKTTAKILGGLIGFAIAVSINCLVCPFIDSGLSKALYGTGLRYDLTSKNVTSNHVYPTDTVGTNIGKRVDQLTRYILSHDGVGIIFGFSNMTVCTAAGVSIATHLWNKANKKQLTQPPEFAS